MICYICGAVFDNVGGKFTNHLKTHNISLKQFVIHTEYCGIAPVCKCGLCNCEPVFYRGRFLKYAKNHNKYSKKESLFIEKYGKPICENCGMSTSFIRGKPKRFCSFKCSGKVVGFGNVTTKNKISGAFIKKYNVSSVSQTTKARIKNSDSLKERWKTGKIKMSAEWCENISKALINKWKDEGYRKKNTKAVKISLQNSKERRNRSNRMKKRWTNNRIGMLNLLAESFKKNGSSKLHINIRNALNLSKFGFKSEVPIYKYIVDEANVDKKIVIEIFGNYVHANPRIYRKNDLIRLPHCSYYAFEKWEKDAKRITELSRLGFSVIIIWEDDQNNKRFDEIRKKIDDSSGR